MTLGGKMPTSRIGCAFVVALVLGAHCASAYSAEESVAEILQRYESNLESLNCYDEEPPGKIKGCSIVSEGRTIHICFYYESKYLFKWAPDWNKSKILQAKVRRVMEEKDKPMDCVWFEPSEKP